ncbi:MAG: hypothetical protein M3R27_02050 [Bacteroidota bacterium]|nr:hypothetical protein [Bacteroidota bacterium]
MLKNLFILFFGTCSFLNAQEESHLFPKPKKEKGQFYFSWGYNKDWFSKSDIHFSDEGHPDPVNKYTNSSYDFVVYDVEAKDRPGFKDILRTDLTIPQYVYRIGYFFNKEHDLGIEINFDHAKYVMRPNQTLRVKGTIHGQQIDQDTLITGDFLHLEHTDGANFMMVNIMKRHTLLGSKNNKHVLRGVVKLGAGVVIPKTYVRMWGEDLDNRFHVAGYCAGLETGLRYEAFRYVFLEYTAKGVFANYNRVLTMGTGKANHHFWTFENILALGLQFPL